MRSGEPETGSRLISIDDKKIDELLILNHPKCKKLIDDIFNKLNGEETLILDLKGNHGEIDILGICKPANLLYIYGFIGKEAWD